MKKSLRWCFVALFALGASRTEAQLFQGPYGAGGTWNIYEVVPDTLLWVDALEDAQGRIQEGVSGNLVSLHSLEENVFVQSIAGGGDVWLGLTDREGMAPAGMSGGLPAPQEANTLPDPFTQGWAWTSGEPFTFQNWGGGEPNDSGGEDVAHIRGDGMWNDHKSGLGFDDPIAPTLQPGTSTDELAGPLFKYVIEYNTQAGSPFPGIENPGPPTVFPAERLAGPLGTAGNWSIIEYRAFGTATEPALNVVRQIQDIQSGDLDAEVYTLDVPYLDITDPDTNANGGGIITTPPIPYPSDTPGLDDDDIISVAHARIRVQEPGEYTFNVHSDDGFGLRIFGAEFSDVQGNGSLDPISRNTMQHAANTGDSNTQAVTTLAAGEYNVEFMSWERGGGAFYEVTAAKGNFVGGAAGTQAQWLAVGDPSELPQRTVNPEAGFASLTRPLEIYNLNNIVPADGLELLREDILEAIADGTTTASSDDGEIFVIDDNNIVTNGCPFGNFPHDGNVVQFPNTNGNLDNFSTAIFGTFVLDDGDAEGGETLEVTVHVDSDDRSMFRIIGESFDDISANELFDVDGDEVMFADIDVCNTNYSGLITLTEGVEYNFEAYHVENGGDAGMQVLFANGDFLFDPNPDEFSPLVLPGGQGTTFARNIGFLLVPEVEGLPGDYNSDGVVDTADIDLQAVAMKTPMDNLATFDENGDGTINETTA